MQKTINDLIIAWEKGQRVFENWDLEGRSSLARMNLNGAQFTHCSMPLDFRRANLSNSIFLHCNLKTGDFRNANLSGALLKNCAVESTLFKGAITDNFRFEENYCYGHTTEPGDFESLLKEK